MTVVASDGQKRQVKVERKRRGKKGQHWRYRMPTELKLGDQVRVSYHPTDRVHPRYLKKGVSAQSDI